MVSQLIGWIKKTKIKWKAARNSSGPADTATQNNEKGR